MARPTTYKEWYTRLASGEIFMLRNDKSKDVFSLWPVFYNKGQFNIYLNKSCIPLEAETVFIMKDYIHKIESKGDYCESRDLFFSEIEFVNDKSPDHG